MTPLLHDETVSQLEAFFDKDLHALMLVGTNLTGFESIIATTAQKPGRSVMLDVVRPEESIISVDHIRKLKQSFTLRQGKHELRVLIIESAEVMTQEAQNSFLKLLEEPPQGVRFVLLARYAGGLLDTVRSRCSLLRVKPLDESAAYSHYEKAGISLTEMKRAYAIADAEPGKLYHLLSDDTTDYTAALETAKMLLKSTLFERMLFIDELSKDKARVYLVLQALEDVLRALSRTKQISDQEIQKLIKKRHALLQARQAVERKLNTKLVLVDALLTL